MPIILTRGSIAFLCAAVAALSLLLPDGQARSSAGRVRIGVVNTLAPGLPATLLSLAMRPFRSYMEEQTRVAGEVVRGGDAFELANQLRDGRLQVGIFHGHEFAWAKAKHPSLQPIVVCVNPLRSLRACLVTAGASRATSHAELHNKTVALPRDGRDHCRVYLERRCVRAGERPETYYRQVTRPSDSAAALADVAHGRLDAVVVDAAALERYRHAHPARAGGLKVIQQSEEFVPGIIACDRDRFPPAEAQRLREALVRAKYDPKGQHALQLLKLAAFEVPPPDLDAALTAIATAYPAPVQ